MAGISEDGRPRRAGYERGRRRASRHAARQPNAEIIDRWEAGEFALLHSLDVLLEHAEKLIATRAPAAVVSRFIARVIHLGEAVRIEFFHLRHYPTDADDIAFLLCALNGEATHLVSYDPHLHALAPHYALTICEPLRFLGDLRTP